MKLIFNFKSLCSTTVVSLIAVTSVSGCLPHGTAGMSKSKSFNGSTENVGIRFDLSRVFLILLDSAGHGTKQ